MTKSETITIEKATIWKITTGIFVVLFLVVLLNGNGASNVATPVQQGGAAPSVDFSGAIAADDPVIGDKDAPITIIEFSYFSCPLCGAASGLTANMVAYMKNRAPSWTATVPEIIANYVNTGKAKLVYKYFPWHGGGLEAMKYALCANEQGKFEEVHNALFPIQDSIDDVAAVKAAVLSTGVNEVDLDKCFNSGKYDGKLALDTQAGKSLGISGTPGFLIVETGSTEATLISCANTYAAFQHVLES